MSFIKYDEEGNQIRKRVGIDCQMAIEDGEKVLVEQSHIDEVDINKIIKRHGTDLIAKTSVLTQFVYDDVTGNDFQETMNILIKARDTFSNVPSNIRKQFDNDPAKFMDFVYNAENKDKLVEMGLADPPPAEPQPVQVEVVNQVTETPPAE